MELDDYRGLLERILKEAVMAWFDVHIRGTEENYEASWCRFPQQGLKPSLF